MISIKSEKKNYGIKFPVSIDEITPEILNEITKQVKLPKHYCIIALCFKTRLFDFVVAMNSNKEQSISIITLLAKINEEDSDEINSSVGDKVVLSRSSLEMATHISLPTLISTENARNYIMSDDGLSKAIVTNSTDEIKELSKNNIILIEFKILPVSDIKSSMPIDIDDVVDPFVYFGNDNN